jgi:signal transduction histidine kinase
VPQSRRERVPAREQRTGRAPDEVGRLALRRRMVATVVVAVVAFIPLDLIAGSTQTWALNAARALLLGTYLPAWWLLPRVSEEAGTRLLAVVVMATSPAVALLCMGTGGPGSPAFSFVWSWPLWVGLMFLEQPRLALLSGVPSMASGGWLLWRDGRPPAFIVYWLMVTAVCTMVAAAATTLYRRVHVRELRIEQERAEALRKLAEAERERARLERLAFIGGLAAGVAHEVNNPLGFLKCNLGWLSGQLREGALLADPEETGSVLAESLQGITRIERIMEGLKAYSGDGPEELVEVSVPEIIREGLSLVADRLRGVRVEVDAPPSLPCVLGSRERLLDALHRLFLNAADALEGRPPASRWLRVGAREADGRLQVDVVDGGPGLPRHVLERLFQPFVTTKQAGAGVGLGLPIACEHVRRHGGTLEGGNEEGAGARFRMTLPVAGA